MLFCLEAQDWWEIGVWGRQGDQSRPGLPLYLGTPKVRPLSLGRCLDGRHGGLPWQTSGIKAKQEAAPPTVLPDKAEKHLTCWWGKHRTREGISRCASLGRRSSTGIPALWLEGRVDPGACKEFTR